MGFVIESERFDASALRSPMPAKEALVFSCCLLDLFVKLALSVLDGFVRFAQNLLRALGHFGLVLGPRELGNRR